jgi:hypothetical protein
MRTTVFLISLSTAAAICAAPAVVSFAPSPPRVGCHDFIEITVNVDQPDVANPFTEASVVGEFGPVGGPVMKVDGFCDAADGHIFRIRFMPTRPGDHEYSVVYRQGTYEVRFRTTATSPNGEPALSSPGGDEFAPAVVGLSSPAGDLAVLYFSAGGAAKLKPGSMSTSGSAQWFNRRTGQYSDAQADPIGGFVTSDQEDWALLIQGRPQGIWPGAQRRETTPEEVGMDPGLLARDRD